MQKPKMEYDVHTFNLPLPHSDITLLRVHVPKSELLICVIEVLMWAHGYRHSIVVRFDLNAEKFIDPIFDTDGVVDEDATAKLKLQRYAIASMVHLAHAGTEVRL